MAVDLADLAQKVRDQITGLYAQGGQPALGVPQVAFEPLGIPVPTASFQANPTDPGPVPALAQRRVSALANQVPTISNGVYFRTEFQIDEFYQYLIHGLQPTAEAAGTSGPLFTLLAQAQQLYEEGDIPDVLNAGDKIYPAEAEPADWYLPGTPDSWTSFRFTSDSPAGTAAPGPHTVMLRMMTADTPAPAAAKPQWSWTLGTTPAPAAPAVAPAASSGAAPAAAPRFIAASLVAARAPAGAAPAASLMVARAADAPAARAPAPVPTARAMQMRALLVNNNRFFFAQPVRVSSSAPAQADGFELSFDLRAVSLHRPWMSLGILADRRWFLPGYRAGEFGDQLLPAIPVTMLVARNVIVKVTGSATEAAMNAVGFGPFSLAGRQATAQSVAGGMTQSTLSAPTPQIIGWVAQPMKGLAPVADPALPPQ